MDAILSDRVTAGANLLDEKWPGWYSVIALDRLAMESCTQCILGQLCGNYHDGLDFIGIQLGEPKGFYSNTKKDDEALAELWRAEIKNRLEKKS